MRRIMVFLQSYGLTPGLAARIYRQYGAETIERLREDPYRLADEMFGVGFRRADEIAQAMGVEGDSLQRARAAVRHVLHEALGEGHVYLPGPELVCRVVEFGVSEARADEALQSLAQSKRIVVEEAGARVYLAGIIAPKRPSPNNWRCWWRRLRRPRPDSGSRRRSVVYRSAVKRTASRCPKSSAGRLSLPSVPVCASSRAGRARAKRRCCKPFATS